MKNTPIILGLALALAASGSYGQDAALGAGKQSAEMVHAQRILQETGVTGGLVVHVGCGDGKLTMALRAEVERELVPMADAVRQLAVAEVIARQNELQEMRQALAYVAEYKIPPVAAGGSADPRNATQKRQHQVLNRSTAIGQELTTTGDSL